MANELTRYEDDIARELVHPDVVANFLTAMPPWLNMDQFRGQAAIMAANPPLDKDKRPPLIGAMVTALLNCAQMGLMPGPSKHVAFVNRKGVLLAQPQWQGVQFLFGLAGWNVTAHIVHTSDVFEVEAIGPDEFTVVSHSYDPFAERTFAFPDKGLRGVYVKGVSKETGDIRFRFVNLERIKRAIGATQTSTDATPWRTDFRLMVEKTAYHQAISRRWFPMPSEVLAALELAQAADYTAIGATVDTTAKPTVSNVAQRIAATATPKALTVDATEPTGFADASDRKAFMAELGKLGWKYDDVAAWCECAKRPRPSAMTVAQRVALLDYLLTDAGKAKVKAWLEARSASVRLADPEPAPLPYTQQERAAEGKPACPKCGATGGEIDRALGECSLCGGL